jgi:hypothetical protein
MGFAKEVFIDDIFKKTKQFKVMLKDKLFWQIFRETF